MTHRSWRRTEGRAFLELLALTGFAIAQPLFAHLGRNAAQLVTGGYRPWTICTLIVFVLLVPPIVLLGLEILVGRISSSTRRALHTAIIVIAAASVVVTALKSRTALGAPALLAIGAAAGMALALAVRGFEAVQSWLRYLASAPFMFAALFIFSSPASALILEGDTSTAHVDVRHPHRVVMIVMDEFPLMSLLDGNGAIDSTRFPNFARLARGSTWYRNSTTVSPSTETAVPALLTGRMPTDQNTLPSSTSYPQNLFTLLGGTYDMNVHETLTHLCPSAICASTATKGNAADLLDTAAADWWSLASPEREPVDPFKTAPGRTAQRAGGPFVRSLRRSAGPRLDFLHVLLPHQAWRYLPTGQDNGAQVLPGTTIKDVGTPSWTNEWSALSGRQAHLLQVQATDRLLGQILDRLHRIGAYDDSLVVVTADHGVAFVPGQPLRGISSDNGAQIVWTPLFIKAPGQRAGSADDRLVRSVDVLPTIADRLGIRLPWTTSGRPVTRPPRSETTVRTLDWWWNTVHPTTGDSPYVGVDVTRGFAEVLGGRATTGGSDDLLALYRLGPYGDLVGRPVGAGTAIASNTHATISRGGAITVRPHAHAAPWTRPGGSLVGVPPNTWIAISVNGVVGGLSQAYAAPGGVIFWSELPPAIFRRGRNDERLWIVSGAPEHPQLAAIPMGN